MIEYKSFLEKYYPNVSEQKREDIARFITHVNEILGSDSIESALTDEEFLCRTFYLQKTNGISRPHYLKIKDYLLNLCDYYKVYTEIPTREEAMASQTTICYFKDLDALLDFIDDVGMSCLSHYNKRTDFANVKTVVCLGWYGLTAQEIAILPRSCTIKEGDSFWIIKPNGDQVKVPERIFTIISEFGSLTAYFAKRQKSISQSG